jgi:hypothetical protein
MKQFILVAALLLACPLITDAAIPVKASEPKRIGSNSVVKLELKNTFTEKIESARAVMFLINDQGRVVGQSTKWVIG